MGEWNAFGEGEAAVPTSAPDGCTCIWSTALDDDLQPMFGSVHISMGRDCPAYPHPRRWSAGIGSKELRQ